MTRALGPSLGCFHGTQRKVAMKRALYLEGQGDLISRLIVGKSRVIGLIIGVKNLHAKSP